MIAVWLIVVLGLAWQRPASWSDQLTAAPRMLRGEDWRGAVALSAARIDELSAAGKATQIWLDPGLIESARLLAVAGDDSLQYLSFPLHGPYSLPPQPTTDPQRHSPTVVRPMVRQDSVAVMAMAVQSGEAEIVILRGSSTSAQRWADQVIRQLTTDGASNESSSSPSKQWQFHHRPFGGVQWLQFQKTDLGQQAYDSPGL